MLTLWWIDVVLGAWACVCAGLVLGWGVHAVLVRPRPEPWTRRTRDWEQDRFGSAMDGSLSRLRWLPVTHAEEE